MVTWKAVVTLDNVDIASNLFGSIEVNAKKASLGLLVSLCIFRAAQ